MTKIILLYAVAFLTIFPLFWNHGNATTPRKLGTRQNAVTSLSNTYKITYRGSGGQYFPVSNLLIHENAKTPRILGSQQNTVTSLPYTEETTSDEPGHQYFAISSSPNDHANVATPHILGARHNAVTGEATSSGSEHQDSHIPSSYKYNNSSRPTYESK